MTSSTPLSLLLYIDVIMCCVQSRLGVWKSLLHLLTHSPVQVYRANNIIIGDISSLCTSNDRYPLLIYIYIYIYIIASLLSKHCDNAITGWMMYENREISIYRRARWWWQTYITQKLPPRYDEYSSGLILGVRPANERRCYFVIAVSESTVWRQNNVYRIFFLSILLSRYWVMTPLFWPLSEYWRFRKTLPS